MMSVKGAAHTHALSNHVALAKEWSLARSHSTTTTKREREREREGTTKNTIKYQKARKGRRDRRKRAKECGAVW